MVNVVLNAVTVVLMIIAAASGVNPDLADEMVEVGINADDVPTLIWISAIGASGMYIMATGKGLLHYIIGVQNNILEAFQWSLSTSGSSCIVTTMIWRSKP